MTTARLVIDPELDELGRLWQLQCWNRLKLRKAIIDPATQHLRQPMLATFVFLRSVARAKNLAPRQLIDGLIDGALAIRRQDPTFIPKTSNLSRQDYVMWLLRSAGL